MSDPFAILLPGFGTMGRGDDMDGDIQRPHDEFFKALLEQPGTAGALLRERLPPEVVALLAEGEPQLVPCSFIHPELSEHQADRLFRVRLKDGSVGYVYCLIEHKSSPEPRVALQLLRYLTDLWVQLNRDQGDRGPLPLVVPLVVYNGTVRWGGVRHFAELLGNVGEVRPHLLAFAVFDLGREADEALSRQPELCAGLLLLKYAFALPAGDRGEVLVRLLRPFADKPDFLVAAVSFILRAYPKVDESEVTAVLKKVSPGNEEEFYSKAALKIMARTEAKTTRAKLLTLLERRFGALPAPVRERVAAAELAQLDAWFDRGIDAQSLEDVFEGQTG